MSPLELKEPDVTLPGDSDSARDMKTLSLIKMLGIITIVLGALPVCDYLLRIALLVRDVLAGMKPPGNMLLILILVALSLVLPVAKIIGGYGLLRLRLWARRITIAVFGIEYFIGFIAALFFCAQCYRFRHMPPAMYDEVLTIGTLRMMPTYIFALISLLFIALLTRESVSNAFSKGGAPSP